jgi:hypothetical protein
LPRIRADGSPAGPRPRPRARHRPAPPAPGATRAAAVTARRPPCAAPQRRRSGGATACRRSPARRPRRRAGRCCAPALAAAAILIVTLHSAQLAQRNVTLIGFPGGSKAPLVCPSATTKGFDGRFLEIACDNFAPGVSGGPFLRNFDGKRGDIIGVIGGYKTGGSRDDISCSSQFDSDVVRLCNQAVNDYEPDTPKGADGLGDAKLWRHAMGAASGTFHTESQKFGDSDVIVRWSDGEMTLYPGDQNQGFYTGCKAGQPCEVQLAGPNDFWSEYADVTTAGEYTGSNAYDLMVKWVDGEVTIYKDIDQKRHGNCGRAACGSPGMRSELTAPAKIPAGVA